MAAVKPEGDVVVGSDGAAAPDPSTLAIPAAVDQSRASARLPPKEAKWARRMGKYVPNSLYCLDRKNTFRRAIVALIEWPWFDRFILVLILANSIVLALTDYQTLDENGEPSNASWRNAIVDKTELFFTVSFTIECVIKIVAMGFFFGHGAYLRDGWNVLDFIVVVTGVLGSWIPNISAFRTVRVLRPLRSLTVMPEMQKLVMSLLSSIPGLFNVVVLLGFMFAIFSILGVQLWAGSLHPRCRLTPWPVKMIPGCGDPLSDECRVAIAAAYAANGTAGAFTRCLAVPNDDETVNQETSPWATPQPCFWPVDSEVTRVCSLAETGTHVCGFDATGNLTYCGSDFDAFGNPRFASDMVMERATYNVSFNWGFTGFDNLAMGLVTIFQVITMEGWIDIMYLVQDSYNAIVAAAYFIFLILFGSFFLLNLTLAVIWDNFASGKEEAEASKGPDDDDDDEEEEEGDGGNGGSNGGSGSGSGGKASRSEAVAYAAGSTASGHGPDEAAGRAKLNDAAASAGAGAGSGAAAVGDAAVQVPVLEPEDGDSKKAAGQQDGAPHPCAPATPGAVMHTIVTTTIFNAFIIFLIAVNTIVLSADHYPMEPHVSDKLEIVNFILTILFTIEMFMKLYGLGLREYAHDAFNLFDAFIVVVSLIELVLLPPSFLSASDSQSAAGGAISALRTFRLFRVFKLARSWRSLNILLKTIVATLADVANFAVLLLLFMYIFSLVGMQFFANSFCFHPSTGLPRGGFGPECDPPFIRPRAHFDDLLWSFVTIFQILTGENWNIVMYDGWRASGWIAVFYFISLVVMGNFIVLNLFLAILLGNFEGMEELSSGGEDTSAPASAAAEGADGEAAASASASSSSASSSSVRRKACSCFRRSTGKGQRVVPVQSIEGSGGGGSSAGAGASSEAQAAANGRVNVKPAAVRNELALHNMEDTESKHDASSRQLINPNAANLSARSITTQQQDRQLLPPVRPTARAATPGDDDGAGIGLPRHSSGGGGHSPVVPRIAAVNAAAAAAAAASGTAPGGVDTVQGSPGAGLGAGIAANGDDDGAAAAAAAGAGAGGGDAGAAGRRESAAQRTLDEIRATTAKKPLVGRALWLLGPKNRLRQAVSAMVQHALFDNVILVLILISSIVLAVDNPLSNPESTGVKFINILDYIFTTLFTLEMIVKLITFGFFLNGPNSYIRSGWNQLDFVIVVVSILSITATGSGSSVLRPLRSLRTLRALRPLRVISRRPGLRLVVNALFSSMKAIMNVLFVCVLFFLIFGIVGVNYFKGQFNICQGDAFNNLQPEQQRLIIDPEPWATMDPAERNLFSPEVQVDYEARFSTKAPTSMVVCGYLDADWEELVPQNFNNIVAAMGVLFEMSTTEGWVDVMYAGVDANGIEMQPKRDNVWGWVFFFMLFMVAGSFFVMNLFVGVVIDNFNTMKERLGDNYLLTDEQKEWVKTQKRLIKRVPKGKKRLVPKTCCRAWCYRLVTTTAFDVFIMTCIVMNTVIMAMNFFGEPHLYTFTLEMINYFFSVVFTIEAILKLTALHCAYFKDNWNVFDFLIVVGTNVGLILQFTIGLNIGPLATVIRTFRVGRIFRLIKSAKSLRKLFQTLMLTLPSLGNIGGLLFLLFFIYAVMGVQLFAKVELQEYLNQHANFQGFWVAIVTLMRASTGEAWNFIMYDVATRSPGCVSQLEYTPGMCGFDDDNYCQIGGAACSSHTDCGTGLCVECTPINGCGSGAAYPFFISFTLLVTFVFLNMFIAVILEGISNADDSKVTDEHLQEFFELWEEYDPHRRRMISTKDLELLITRLSAPLGFGNDPDLTPERLQERLAGLALPLYSNNEVFLKDVVKALVGSAFETIDGIPDNHVIHDEWSRIFPSPRGELKKDFSIDKYYAGLSIKRGYKAYKLRKEVHSRIDEKEHIAQRPRRKSDASEERVS